MSDKEGKGDMENTVTPAAQTPQNVELSEKPSEDTNNTPTVVGSGAESKDEESGAVSANLQNTSQSSEEARNPDVEVSSLSYAAVVSNGRIEADERQKEEAKTIHQMVIQVDDGRYLMHSDYATKVVDKILVFNGDFGFDVKSREYLYHDSPKTQVFGILQDKKKVVLKVICKAGSKPPTEVKIGLHLSSRSDMFVCVEKCFYSFRLWFMVLEAHKGDLETHFTKIYRLNKDALLRSVKSIAEAINYMHQSHIVHRDLKLSNILVTNTLGLRIGDFGTAIVINRPETSTCCRLNDNHYTLPEARIGYIYKAIHADVWSFGVIAHRLLTGKFFMPNTSVNHIIGLQKRGNLKIRMKDVSKNPEYYGFFNNIFGPSGSNKPSMAQILREPLLADVITGTVSGQQGVPIKLQDDITNRKEYIATHPLAEDPATPPEERPQPVNPWAVVEPVESIISNPDEWPALHP